MSIGVYTSVCEEDACWIPQYLKEVERLNLHFGMHLDRCSTYTKNLIRSHPNCIGTTENILHPKAKEFNDTHKQGVFDLVVKAGFDWAMAWDIDETYARDTPQRLEEIQKLDYDYIDTKWVNLWGDEFHIRVDGPFSGGHRVKFYNLQSGFHWKFEGPITNGAKGFKKPGAPWGGRSVCLGGKFHQLVCMHWGMMTEELRLQHKARWDRIYTTAVGNNPYGFWDYSLDSSITPVIVPNEYL